MIEGRAFGLHICPPCRAGDHPHCRTVRDQHGRLLFCECPGFSRRGGALEPLPCTDPPERTCDAR